LAAGDYRVPRSSVVAHRETPLASRTAVLSPEDHVRLYLQYLEDPDSLRDEAAIAKAEAAVDRAKDPIAKVKAITALERAQAVDPESYRHGFVTNVKAWVEIADVTATSLLQVGVPEEDLVEAGLLVAEPIRRRGRGRVATTKPTRSRAARLTLDEVVIHLPKKEFRLTELAESIDREPATTRNYLNKLIDQGIIAEVGDDPRHSGKGKAPKLYARA
jgi:hypothetical protein